MIRYKLTRKGRITFSTLSIVFVVIVVVVASAIASPAENTNPSAPDLTASFTSSSPALASLPQPESTLPSESGTQTDPQTDPRTVTGEPASTSQIGTEAQTVTRTEAQTTAQTVTQTTAQASTHDYYVCGFSFGSDDISDQTADSIADAVSDYNFQPGRLMLAIEGFAGADELLLQPDLHNLRAQAVRDELISRGVPDEDILMVKNSNENEGNGSVTARVEIFIILKPASK